MAGGHWHGGRLKLLPAIRAHEDLVELDFADRGWDYRDRYRPGGGVSRLTIRRLLLLVDGMDRLSSRFWAELDDREPITQEALLMADVFNGLTGEKHPLRDMRENIRTQKDREMRKRIIRENARRRRRQRRASRGVI